MIQNWNKCSYQNKTKQNKTFIAYYMKLSLNFSQVFIKMLLLQYLLDLFMPLTKY